jgi:uncharacterized protein involved in exopolysaccharide biosynthesis
VQDELVFDGTRDSESPGPSPHIADYWQVVARRLWLVVLIFGVTTASAIWAVAQQFTIYETRSSIQINDPLEVTRGLTASSGGLSGVNLFVDPIESEIQVRCSKHGFGRIGMNSDRGRTVPARLVTRLPAHADPSLLQQPSTNVLSA